MPQMISWKNSKKARNSKIKRLKFLPRVGISIDFGGKVLTYKGAPTLETLYNAFRGGKLSYSEVISIGLKQLEEIQITKIKN